MDNKNIEDRFEQELVQKDLLLNDENIHLLAEDMLDKHLNRTSSKVSQ